MLYLVFAAAAFAAASDSAPNLLTNPAFDDDLAGWESRGRDGVAIEAIDGRLRIAVPDTVEPAWPLAAQSLPAEPGDIVEMRWTARGETRNGKGGYASIDFLDAEGKRISYSMGPPAQGDGSQGAGFVHHAVAPAGTARLSACLILHGHGTAWFDDVSLAKIGRVDTTPAAEAVLTVAPDSTGEPFQGFGFEDDGWAYNPDNAAIGVTEADLTLREQRIAWMAPDVVRMFFWIQDWCPSGDWKTFAFDSPNMLSHYRTLDVYERLGTPVIVTGVEWGVSDPWADPEAAGEAIAALLRHLVRDKGYTCVQGWMLTNEPDIAFHEQGGSFDDFVAIHRVVRARCEAEGLPIALYGSDDALGLPWFERCITTPAYASLVDAWSSHRYFPGADRHTAPWFYRDRLALIDAHTPGKPFLVTEFGFQDIASSHLDNPLMKSYDYALWSLAFAFDGLNAGADGFAIWCLHETLYPGGTHMRYGLWDGESEDWRPRPVYHAWAMLTRLTKRGDAVRTVASSAAHAVKAAVVGERLFWVNEQDGEMAVRVEGYDSGGGRVFTEGALSGDRDASQPFAAADGAFVAPPRSFGYLEPAAAIVRVGGGPPAAR